MRTLTLDDIDDHFSRWGCSKTPVAGFLAYCWDNREDTLLDLQMNDRRNIEPDIIYTLEQDPRLQDLVVDAHTVGSWVDSKRDDLVIAIAASLKES